MKKWQIHQPSEEAAKQIRSSSDLSMLCAQVLAARGMHNVQEAAAFLQCDGLADPFLTADMEAAAACINTALDDGSRICIYSDHRRLKACKSTQCIPSRMRYACAGASGH
mgnify:CR=1 FL=1